MNSMSFHDRGQLLFVIGMHRSGTSALCAALAASGVSFGSQLIAPMAGVNDEGFWEDAGVVAVNEQLLAELGSSWYAPAYDPATLDWAAARFEPMRERARALLTVGFGEGALQAVKDPRLCLTLPFWLALCSELGLPARVCVIGRAPLEVARSLEARDGFPIGYGLRLYALYRSSIESFVPDDTVYVRYDDLLRDPQSVMARLVDELSLIAGAPDITVVRGDLRHHQVDAGSGMLTHADSGDVDLIALQAEIEAHYPLQRTLCDFTDKLTSRGLELARIGEEHAAALATLDERDRDIESLSAEHRKALATVDERDADIESLAAEHRIALATIDERDEQIREFDRRLSKLGEEHSRALESLRGIKQIVDTISKVPGLGYLIRRIR
jgi:hypothetical protein